MFADIANWVGLIGGISGLVALGLQLYELQKNRKPQLKLFIPYHFTGTQHETKYRTLFLLLRISNSTNADAFLYLETLRVELLYKGIWYQVTTLDIGEEIQTDFPEVIQHLSGVKYVKGFNKFKSPAISRNNPFSTYLPVTFPDMAVIENAEEVRITVKDCHLEKYTLQSKIILNDPQHL